MLLRVFVMAAVFLGSFPAAAKPAPFPAEFRGVWGANVETGETCRVRDFEERNSDALMQVTARQMEFWESRCDVTSLTRKDDTINVKMTCYGEGETWQDSNVMTIKPIAGRTYLLTYSGGYISAYAKCRP